MKILIIQHNSVDYLQDAIFLGMKDKFGDDVESIESSYYLYKGASFNKHHLWGMGFTYTNILNPSLGNVVINPLEKIKDKYYDLIIYTSISRNSWELDEVIKITDGKNVMMVNVEDGHWNFDHYNDKCIYFKRELYENKEKNIFPISYAIHESKFINFEPIKTQEISKSIPSLDYCTNISSSKIIFDNEQDYYKDYQISKFGITKKKGGWDSMRHYEILANKCIPLFEDIDRCPDLCLTTLPKKLLSEIYNRNYKLNETEYNFYLNELFNYAKLNLTTNKLADYILNYYN